MKKYLFYISQLYSFSIVRPLQKVIRKRGDEVYWFFDNPELQSYLRDDELCFQTVSEVKKFMPDVVFVPGNIVPSFFPGIKVELFHGFHARKRSDERGHFRIRGFFDLYCTQGPDTTLPFLELAEKHGYFEVVETGWPKMDPLFTTDIKEKSAQPVIYLASTFTPRLSCAQELFAIVQELTEKREWRWLVNFHPKMDPEVIELYKSIESDRLTYIETDNVIPLMQQADVMVADTSSVISEFLLQNKPIVTYKNNAPGEHLLNITQADDLEGAIEQALVKPDELMSSIREYGDNIHPYRDGLSSVRVLEAADRLLSTGTGHLKNKPLNLIRNYKIRKKLGYYWF